MPSAVSVSWTAIPTSGSYPERIRSERWSRVARVPSRSKSCASSRPMYPPPTMMSDRGCSVSSVGSSELRWRAGYAPIEWTGRDRALYEPP